METALEIAGGVWATLCVMAPYLLLGFAMSLLLARYVTPAVVRRHLGEGKFLPVLKATFFGIPLPLCSCGVIPVAASLKRHGAHGGPTVAFITATPQIGVDSILVTSSLLGPLFTAVRVLAAFVSGFGAGVLVSLFGEKVVVPEAGVEEQGVLQRTWGQAVRHAFVILPRDLFNPMLLGLLVAGVVGTLVPVDFVDPSLGHGWSGKLAMLALGIPVYVCATASVPMAAALILAGFSPGAALVFLMTGPATNAATIGLVWKDLGLRTALIYLCTVAVVALAAGIALDLLPAGFVPDAASLPCHVDALGVVNHLWGALLVAIFLWARWGRLLSRPND